MCKKIFLYLSGKMFIDNNNHYYFCGNMCLQKRDYHPANKQNDLNNNKKL